MSIELLYPFTTPGNYTFDSDVIEVSGGVAKLKDQRPADATFFANYNTDINGNWGGGVLTGTPVGGAAVSGGKLDLVGGTKYVDYDADLNADSQVKGAIRFSVIPNWNNGPASGQVFISLSKQAGSSDNRIQVQQNNDGNLAIFMNDELGSSILSGNIGVWSPVLGVEYEFEFNYDLTGGGSPVEEARLFIDGVQFGSTLSASGTRSADIGLLRVGNGVTSPIPTNFKLDNVIIFDDVQHTANYTPGQSIPATVYAIDNPQLVCNATFRCEGIDAFVETKSASGSDEIKYILKKGTVKYYWSGAAWVVSDGTYAQANTAAEIETNKATFTTVGVTVEITVLFHSDDGSTTPEIDTLQVDYDFSGSAPDTIDTCIVWGYTIQTDTGPDVETVKVFLVNDAVQYKTNITIMRETYTLTPDSNGYWEVELVETDNMQRAEKYAFQIGDEYYERGVPDVISANFYELT